jgi:hypothetical protein
MLEFLRHTSSANMGFDPAQAMVEAWNHPEFQQRGMRLNAQQGTQSAGDYAISQVAGSNFGMNFLNYADTMHKALVVGGAQQSKALAVANTKLRNIDPVGTAMLSLHSIPGITQSDGDKLMQAVVPRANQLVESGAVPFTATGDAIDKVILQQKFDDPGLEKLRQTAAKDWIKHRQIMQDGLAGFMGHVQGTAEAGLGAMVRAQHDLPPIDMPRQ